MNNQFQDYADGRMEAEARAEFESHLANDSSLNAEYQAFLEFRSSVRSAGLQEQVPNLQPMLAQICRPKPVFWRSKAFTWTASAAVCFIAFYTFAQSPMVNPSTGIQAAAATIDLTKSPLQNHWHVSDPAEAAEAMRKSIKCPVPVLKLDGLGASMVSAECGSCWIAFDLEYQETPYTIFGRRERGGLDGGKTVDFENKKLFVFPDAVGWYCTQGMTYVIKGGTPDARLAIAKIACKETPASY